MNLSPLLSCLIFLTSGLQAAEKTNVLFIICDDLNRDLGCYGNSQVKTPNLDRLASRGLLFENASCQFPLCGPSRASFMTGLYPDQTGITRNAIRIREKLPTVVSMSQMFRNNGWHATRIGKIYHYNVPADIGNPGHDDPASWDETVNPRGRDKDDEALIFSLKKGQFGATLSWLAADGEDAEQTDAIAAAEAVARLKQSKADQQPFFLAVGLYRPHTPFVAPKKYFDLYPLDSIEVPTVPDGYLKTLPPTARKTLRAIKNQVDLDTELARKAIQAYHASISFADAQIGLILDALNETGLAANTIVIFTSDHGYHMGEHGHWQKRTLFDRGSQVPLIIAAPGMKGSGETTRCPAEMIDFYPTLAELCGLTPPAGLPGVSLAPLLDDPEAEPRRGALTKLHNGYSLRTARYRYTEWGENGADGNELYDHESDPAEMRNLADDPAYASVVDELGPRLRARIKDARSIPEGLERK